MEIEGGEGRGDGLLAVVESPQRKIMFELNCSFLLGWPLSI